MARVLFAHRKIPPGPTPEEKAAKMEEAKQELLALMEKVFVDRMDASFFGASYAADYAAMERYMTEAVAASMHVPEELLGQQRLTVAGNWGAQEGYAEGQVILVNGESYIITGIVHDSMVLAPTRPPRGHGMRMLELPPDHPGLMRWALRGQEAELAMSDFDLAPREEREHRDAGPPRQNTFRSIRARERNPRAPAYCKRKYVYAKPKGNYKS